MWGPVMWCNAAVQQGNIAEVLINRRQFEAARDLGAAGPSDPSRPWASSTAHCSMRSSFSAG